MQQLGCEWAMVTGLDEGDELELHCAENCALAPACTVTAATHRTRPALTGVCSRRADTRIKERFAAFDVQVYRIGHHRVHNVPEITLNQHIKGEQYTRAACRTFLQFNGSGGLWRKAAMDSAGGWNDETLVEDMDLSLRA